jgi:hypothetical protein
MTADKALEIIVWAKDRRDYRRACGLRRPADEAADTAAEDRARRVLDALRITADAFYSMAGR